jgi:hypothetical protein
MKKTLFWGICFLFIFIYTQPVEACSPYISQWEKVSCLDTDNDNYCEEFELGIELVAGNGCTNSVYVVFTDDTDNVLGKAGPWTITGTVPAYYYVTIYADWFNLQSPAYVLIMPNLYEALGDVNSDASVDLQDTLLFLKGMTAVAPHGTMNPGADANGDSRLCIEDALYTLQFISNLRTHEWLDGWAEGVSVDTP